ncbi:permease [Geobacillus sp. FSL W8-0466]|uniref:permease n=1 Tax=Geobacillus TaxID=129337 RepID=UPI002E244860|nr:permease [Geobacillus stearothermophilus]
MTRVVNKWKDFVDELLAFKWILFGVVIYIYGLSAKEHMYVASSQTKLLLNKWDLLHKFFGDIYLILYFILPVFLYRSISIMMSDFDYAVLIRLGSYRSWVYATLVRLIQSASISIIVWGAVSLVLSIGAPSFAGWSPFSRLNASLSETQILQKFINSPILALVLHLALLVFSVSCIHLVLAILYVKWKNKGIVVFVAVFIWVYGVVSFKLLSPHSLFNLCHYLILHSGAAQFSNIWGSFAMVIGWMILLIWIVNRLDLNVKRYNGKYTAFIVLVVLALWSGMRENVGQTVWDQFLFMFIGSSRQAFYFKSFLCYWVLYFGVIYLVQLHLQTELSEMGYYKLVRYQSISRWFWAWYHKTMLYIGLYLFALALLALFILSLKRFSFDFHVSIDRSVTLLDMFYHFFVNGYLQVSFYVLFVFLISWLSKETFYSFVGLAILSFFMFPGLNNWGIIPSGLNSMAYLLTNDSIYRITIVLFLWNVFSIVFLLYVFSKQDLDF